MNRIKHRILLLALALILLTPQARGANQSMKYGFYPEWSPDSNAITLTQRLPFVIQIEGKTPLFLLVHSNSPQAYWTGRMEVKTDWNDKPIVFDSDWEAIEWTFEPRFLTNLSTQITIPFWLAEKRLWKQFHQQPFFCRVSIPIWRLEGRHFTKAAILKSTWFKCVMENEKFHTIETNKESFRPFDGQTLPFMWNPHRTGNFFPTSERP